MKNYGKTFLKMLPFLIILAAAFYGLPPISWIFEDPNTRQATNIEQYIVLALPIICFIVSVLYGGFNGFHVSFPLIVGVLSFPAVLIYYNYTAWIYVVIYIVDSLISSAFGGWYRALSLEEKIGKKADAYDDEDDDEYEDDEYEEDEYEDDEEYEDDDDDAYEDEDE